jgi:hypothetical protein
MNMSLEEKIVPVEGGGKMMDSFLSEFNKVVDEVWKSKVYVTEVMSVDPLGRNIAKKRPKPKYRLNSVTIPIEFWNLLEKESKIFRKLARGRKTRYTIDYPNIGGIKIVKGAKFGVDKTRINYENEVK